MKPSIAHRRRAGWSALGIALNLVTGVATADMIAVVSSRSPVTTLSRMQIADIFLGKTTRFPDGSRAVPIDQAEGVAGRNQFYKEFTGKSAAQIKAHWSKIIFTGRGQPPHVVANDIEARSRLAKDPSAIGYMEQSLIDGSVRALLVH